MHRARLQNHRAPGPRPFNRIANRLHRSVACSRRRGSAAHRLNLTTVGGSLSGCAVGQPSRQAPRVIAPTVQLLRPDDTISSWRTGHLSAATGTNVAAIRRLEAPGAVARGASGTGWSAAGGERLMLTGTLQPNRSPGSSAVSPGRALAAWQPHTPAQRRTNALSSQP